MFNEQTARYDHLLRRDHNAVPLYCKEGCVNGCVYCRDLRVLRSAEDCRKYTKESFVF
jgi:hypothetical protein